MDLGLAGTRVPERLHSGFYWSYGWRKWWWQLELCGKLQIVTTNKWTSSFLQAGCPSCRPTNCWKCL